MDKRVCIFVDGENLRHSIVDLFPNFPQQDYLPKTARWADFFDWIADEVAKKVTSKKVERVRTYWYVVENMDFTPYNLNNARKDLKDLRNILCRNSVVKDKHSRTKSEDKDKYINEIADEMQENQSKMQTRFSGWSTIQGQIENNHQAIEFRRAGAIRYNLFDKSLGSEKAVDVKLATDLIRLKDIYDIAVILSGDQDYVPAVDAIKDFGKHVVNVSFLKENGYTLPIGARRLNQSTDWSLEIKHDDLKKFLGIS